MTDMLPRAALPKRQAHTPSQAQLDGDECMSCDIPFASPNDRVPLEHRDGYRCLDTAACGHRRAAKYGKRKTSGIDHSSSPENGHGVG